MLGSGNGGGCYLHEGCVCEQGGHERRAPTTWAVSSLAAVRSRPVVHSFIHPFIQFIHSFTLLGATLHEPSLSRSRRGLLLLPLPPPPPPGSRPRRLSDTRPGRTNSFLLSEGVDAPCQTSCAPNYEHIRRGLALICSTKSTEYLGQATGMACAGRSTTTSNMAGACKCGGNSSMGSSSTTLPGSHVHDTAHHPSLAMCRGLAAFLFKPLGISISTPPRAVHSNRVYPNEVGILH